MYWYVGNLDLGKFGFYAIFRVQKKDNEKFVFIKFMNRNVFNRDELLDEHRVLRAKYEDEVKPFMSTEQVTMDKVIQYAILDAIGNMEQKSEEDKMELTFYIARKIHLSDPRF